MRCSYSTLVKAKRAGRATSVRATPTGTAVTDYQVSLGNRHSLRESGVIGLPSWSDTQIQTETWVRVPRLAATCPRRVVAFDGGRSSETGAQFFPHFFEHFAGAAIDTGRWTTATVGVAGTVSVADSVATLATKTTNESGVMIYGKTGFGTGTATHARIRTTSTGTVHQCTGIQFCNPSNQYGMFVRPSWVSLWGMQYSNYAGAYSQSAIAAWLTDTWHTVDIRRGASSGTYQIDGQPPVTIATNYYTGTDSVPYLTAYIPSAGSAAQIQTDLVLVRPCAANEPLTGTAQPSTTNRAMSRPMRKADLIRACCT